ncbi:MAG: hypothetical protein JW908_13065 [Anaerolineales bacterium]|nr:hypothetical protein [Anaerolineales bacterium]
MMDLPPSQVKYYPAPPAQKKNTLWWIVGGGIILLLACCVVSAAIGAYFYFTAADNVASVQEIWQTDHGGTPPVMETPFTLPGETLPSVVTEMVATLPPPSITPTSEPTPNVNVNGVSFSFPPGVAQNINTETIPVSDPAQPSGFPGEVYPQHTKLNFEGYPLSGTFHSPYILVYPAQEFAAMNESAVTVINDLTQLLAQKPASVEKIPFLPLWNAAQMFHSNMAYIAFENGNGVRFLSMYGQAFYPVNNNSLFYSFQGLTDDGAYYIAAILPITHPSLPANETDIPGGDFDAFVANIETYWAETTAQLEAQPLDSFTPDISLLDAMFESFSVNP